MPGIMSEGSTANSRTKIIMHALEYRSARVIEGD